MVVVMVVGVVVMMLFMVVVVVVIVVCHWLWYCCVHGCCDGGHCGGYDVVHGGGRGWSLVIVMLVHDSVGCSQNVVMVVAVAVVVGVVVFVRDGLGDSVCNGDGCCYRVLVMVIVLVLSQCWFILGCS